MENSAYKESSAPPSQIDELINVMRSVKRRPEGYRAIHLHFSLIDRLHKQPYHRRAVATAFNKLVQTKDGQLFWMSNFDLVFLCKDCSEAEMDTAIIAARRAIEDSPVLREYKDAGRDHELCDWYDMTRDMTPFMARVANLKSASETVAPPVTSLQSMVAGLRKKQAESAPPAAEKPVAVTRPVFTPRNQKTSATAMGPMQLDQLERNLIHMEIDRMLAQQTACVIVGAAPPQPIFVEHYISVAEIKKNLLPDYDMLADKWLFQRLTRTFDRKLMQALPERNLPARQVISININVESIFSADFDKFIDRVRHKNGQPLILEMKLFDVISDIQAYYQARDKLTALGCRISLDAMDIDSLAVMDRELLSVDFLKIIWKKEYGNLRSSPVAQKITSAIETHGKMRIVLCHCDSEEALDFGAAVGIHMFQGFLIDQKLKS